LEMKGSILTQTNEKMDARRTVDQSTTMVGGRPVSAAP
jgi:hypothetical protein